ncbi:hypothetical protein TWF694_009689 [Orbilia ellipsospora]|uniref:1-alkyl-2-acetylglycerophosphocholine esterase n=1 Tax=Orbilia ellipsospora TaxID=2528407 RepID=A0AAV9XCZ5_9PEZI
MTSLLSRFSPIPYFPPYKGPYEVGTLDIELPVSPFIDSGLSPPCPSHSDIPTVQFRLFYPAALKGQATADGSQSGATWIPSPRKEYVAAYCKFAGAGDFLANVLSYIPRHVYYIKLPVHPAHPILPESNAGDRFPVVIFSHGLAGTRNTYSYLTASLASHGAVVLCPEHRDGSAPASFIREPRHKSGLSELQKQNHPNHKGAENTPSLANVPDGVPRTPSSSGSDSEDDKNVNSNTCPLKTTGKSLNSKDEKQTIRRVDYISQPHEISTATATIRNKQLEIRLWELGVLFAVVKTLNSGLEGMDITDDFHVFPSATTNKTKNTNTKCPSTLQLLQMFKNRLDISTGGVTWMGHSFGGATITQFVKSCWYAPLFRQNGELKDPLYVPSDTLTRHFHPDGEIGERSRAPATVLLDTWCLPLLGDRTRALWKRRLPGPTLGILSFQFYKWKENLRGFRHVMSRKGGAFEEQWFGDAQDERNEQVTPSLPKLDRSSSMDVTPQLPTGFSHSDEAKLQSGEKDVVEEDEEENSLSLKRTASRVSQRSMPGQPDRRLYYATGSAHMSQSDFGVLFPRSARYFTKVDDSEGVLDLNVRALVEFMRERGLNMTPFAEGVERDREIFGEGVVKGWEVVSLELGEEGKAKKKVEEEKKIALVDGDVVKGRRGSTKL